MTFVFAATVVAEMPEPFRMMNLESRSISAGNPTGARGDVPEGTAVHNKTLPAGQKLRLADIAGPGIRGIEIQDWERRRQRNGRFTGIPMH